MNRTSMTRARWVAASIAAALLPCRLAAAPIDPIAAYAGTWNTHIVHYKTRYSKPRTETSTLKNTCFHSPGYVACEQAVDGSVKALIVFTYDKHANVYRSNVFPADGSAQSSGTVLIAGNTWTFPWEDKDGSKAVYLRVVNTFRDPNTIEFRQEYSYDRKHWTVTATGVEHRLM